MTYQKIDVENISVEICYDDWADSPREWDNLTKFALFHKRYNLPNEVDINEQDFNSWDEMRDELELEYKWVFPVYMYDHGGTAFSLKKFSCPWDSGQVGFICVSEKDIWANFPLGTDWDAKAYEIAEAELRTYGHYANGEVYGVRVFEDTEEVDSCFGYFGYDHKESGLLDELDSYLSRITTPKIKEQIMYKLI